MSTDKHPLSVAELIELPHDSWVNDGFTAIVRAIERKTSKQNKPYWKCKLADTTGSAEVGMSMFFAPKFVEGQQVDFLGQGIKFKNGQYGAEVSVGDKTEIHVVGNRVQHEGERPPSDTDAKAAGKFVPGQTVGMAMKESLALALRAHDGKPVKDVLKDPLFWSDVKVYAGNIIRISASLERGNLSPPSWPVAAKPEPKAPAPKPTPGPEGSAFAAFAANDADEDVPF